MGKTCARPLYFAQRAAQVDGEVRWLVLRTVARSADGELFQLVVVVDVVLVRLVLDQLAERSHGNTTSGSVRGELVGRRSSS